MPYKDPEAQKKSQRNYYENNKSLYVKSMQDTRVRRHQYVQDLKESSPCLDCGQFYHYCVMQYDHRDSSEKIDSVSRLLNRVTMDAVRKEIDKCDLVCANCHAIRSFERKTGKSVQR